MKKILKIFYDDGVENKSLPMKPKTTNGSVTLILCGVYTLMLLLYLIFVDYNSTNHLLNMSIDIVVILTILFGFRAILKNKETSILVYLATLGSLLYEIMILYELIAM